VNILLLAALACTSGSDDTASADDTAATDDTASADDTGEAQNAAPSAPTVALSDVSPLSGDSLTCTVVTDSVDPDGDDVTYTYSWTVDGQDAGESGDTVVVGDWQEWACSVVASDGALESDPATVSAQSMDVCVGLASDGAFQLVMPVQETELELSVGQSGDPITLEGWFLIEQGAGAGSYLFYKGDYVSAASSGTLDYHLSVRNSDGELHFGTGPSSSPNDCDYMRLSGAITWGEWHHIAATYDPAGGEKMLFIDGKLKRACNTEQKNPDASGPLTIGGHMYINVHSGEPQFNHALNGVMDEVRVSRSVRYTADFEPAYWLESDADTALLYHFSEAEGTLTTDASGNGRDGQILATTWSSDESACQAYLDQ
jgi:hypothetical protein